MKTRLCSVVIALGLGAPALANAQTPNFPIRNYQSVLGELSAFFSGNPNAPIGGLLDQHARWHHVGVAGGRRIQPGRPGSGLEFLAFHRQFVSKVYDAAGIFPGDIADSFEKVRPWFVTPPELQRLADYPRDAERRLLNNDPAFGSEDELGIFLEAQIHNWIHGAVATVFGDK